MDDKGKLSEQELAAIRERPTTPGYWAECQEADNAIFDLLSHIEAIEAEHQIALNRAIDSVISAAELGTSAEVLILKQLKRIQALESAIRNTIDLLPGVPFHDRGMAEQNVVDAVIHLRHVLPAEKANDPE